MLSVYYMAQERDYPSIIMRGNKNKQKTDLINLFSIFQNKESKLTITGDSIKQSTFGNANTSSTSQEISRHLCKTLFSLPWSHDPDKSNPQRYTTFKMNFNVMLVSSPMPKPTSSLVNFRLKCAYFSSLGLPVQFISYSSVCRLNNIKKNVQVLKLLIIHFL
jgi:hypothetical protein